MDGPSEHESDARIEAQLPLRLSPTPGKQPLLLILIAGLIVIRPSRAAFVAALVVGALVLSWLVERLIRHFRVGDFERAILRKHDVLLGRDEWSLPLASIRSVEPYMPGSVWVVLQNGKEIQFSIAGVPKKDRDAVLSWLQRRIGLAVFE